MATWCILGHRGGAGDAAALADAALAPEDVGYINAHGTGTMANDRAECAAIRAGLWRRAAAGVVDQGDARPSDRRCGAVELLACLMALRDGVLPPTIGMSRQTRSARWTWCRMRHARARVGAALTNAFAFGGLNAVTRR